MAATKRSKGATKRRQPLPVRKWAGYFVKFIGVVAGFVALWFVTVVIRDVRWRPLAVTQYALTSPLIYQEEAQLDDVLQEYLGKSLFFLDLLELNARLEALPWVRQSSVLKTWPGKLTVTLTEHEPVAFWNGEDVLNSEGIPLSRPMAELKLASLQGPENQSAYVMENYLQFAKIFREQNVMVEKVAMRSRGSWSITLRSGIEIFLGEKEVLERSRRVVKFMNSNVFGLDNIKYIDARYPNGVAVKLQDENSLEVKNDIAA
jgi:cell division protein FtsQ